jgi:hypothetical protein
VTPSLSISSTPSVTPSISISITPSITPSVTPSATQFSVLTLCTDNGSGWGSSTLACNGGCTPVTVYVNQVGITSFFQAAVTFGLPLYVNTNFIPANLYNGGNNWFRSTSGEVFQVGTDGAISTFGLCPSVTPTPTRTPSSTPSSTPAPSPSPSISVSSTPVSTPSRTPSITPSTSAPVVNCTFYDVSIDQGDLDDATGNTEPGKLNGVVYFDYVSCNGTPSQLQFSVADYYTNIACVRESTSQEIYYYFNNTKNLANFSFWSDNFTSCT